MNKELFLILHDIRSAHNVGAIFRTADGAGVSKIFLTGYTPVPHDGKRILKSQADKMLAKTALGAEQTVAWEKCEDLPKLLDELKQKGCQLVALEKTAEATDLKKFQPTFPLALVLGNEVEGVSEEVLAKCDAVVSIPMRGQKESLNVSVAAGIAMYEIMG